MPVFRCEFEVEGDLVLSSDVPLLEVELDGSHCITIKNGAVDEEGHTKNLIIAVVGPSDDIGSAENRLRSILAESLDLLSFTTRTRFKILKPLRLLEWEEGQKKRQMHVFFVRDAKYPPSPELHPDFLETVKLLERSSIPKFSRLALRYFRYGLDEYSSEDQFLRFWLALEIVAENIKEKEKIAIQCSECEENMVCAACGFEPTKVPMAKQAIGEIIAGIAGEHADEVFKRQYAARNALMHGGGKDSVERKCKRPMAYVVSELAEISWQAILSTAEIPGTGPISFGTWGRDITNRELNAVVHMEFEHMGEEMHPREDELPNPEVTLITKFGNEPTE